MASFPLDIVTPTKQVFSEIVESVRVPTASGETGVLPRHMPYVALLTEGEIKVTLSDREYFIAIGEGFIEVSKDRVEILVTRAFHADDLNEAEIKQAQIQAKSILSKKGQEVDRAAAIALLRRSTIEMKVLAHRRSGRQKSIR